MNKKRLLTQAIVAAIALSSTQAMAAGFQLNSQSATGLGRAFAGDAVIADNASVISRNAAAMTMFKETSMSIGFTVIDTDVSVKDASYKHLPNHTFGADDIGSTSVVPNFYIVSPINDKMAWGISAYSNFGTGTEFSSDFKAPLLGGTTEVMSMNFGASLAYRLNEQWSIGGGLDLIYGQGKLKRDLGPINALDAEADGFALGFNLGTVYELNENNRFGLSYRHSPTLEAEGDIHYAGNDTDKLSVPLPDMVEFSGYHLLTEKFAAHYSLQWVGWGAFDKVETNGTTIKDYNWKDAGHASIGGTYYLNNDWALRAGYMYDISAADEDKSLSIPDSDRQWFSAGFTYNINSKSNIDFGATYLLGQDVDVTEQVIAGKPLAGTVSATTRANAILVGLQYSRSF
ncbi:outer membrane protein transport protein [Photobacterium profundum]|uniref:OmpP1/FadL family transporter n=1 Tax=Photobacterium profundum TaxID=74109 RepID=UPI003D1457B5